MMNTPLENEVAKRFGVVPNFFRLASSDPKIAANLWGFAEFDSPLASFPAPDSPGEQALFACATHVFLQTPDASQAHEALRRTLGPLHVEQLNLLLAFVRTAHYWTKLHPELAWEDDVIQL